MADPVFWKGGAPRGDRKKSFVVDNVVAPKARGCVARLLGGSGGMPPRKILTISVQNGAYSIYTSILSLFPSEL